MAEESPLIGPRVFKILRLQLPCGTKVRSKIVYFQRFIDSHKIPLRSSQLYNFVHEKFFISVWHLGFYVYF